MGRGSGWCAAAIVLLGPCGPAQADDPCGQALRPYASTLADRVVLGAEALAKRIEAGDLEGARQAWVEARVGWQRAEPFLTSYFPEDVAEIDAWPEADAGFHALERILFIDRDLAAAGDLARNLVVDAVALRRRLEATALEAPGLMAGLVMATADLGRAKAAGGESPLAGTSVEDVRNHLEGIEAVYALSSAAFTRRRQPALHVRIMLGLIALATSLRASSIAEVEGAAMLVQSERLRDAMQEMATLIELEGTDLQE
jgi:iron uptake system component EfeO